MGFVLALLYIGTTYLGTETVFGPLAAFHIEIIIAVLVLVVSLPSLPNSFVLKTHQSLALVGLGAAVFLSVLMTGWIGGSILAFQAFIPSPFAYFLVCLHCNTKKKLQITVILLMFVCLFIIGHGMIEARQIPDLHSLPWYYSTPYLLGDRTSTGEIYFRLRGLSFINDPNDFSQLIACVIPLVFIFWRPKRMIKNILFVLLPVAILLYGAFLTHSRGFLLAFLAMVIAAGRRRIGTVASLILGGVLFAAATVLNFTGGRDISAESGSGRMVLWASSIGLFKSHPLFGVGFGRLADYLGLTAHNSIMVCAAELGMFGFFFWALFLFSTMRDAIVLATPAKVTEGDPTVTDEPPLLHAPVIMPAAAKEEIDKFEINRFGRLFVLSLTGFLVTGFFLSRAFVMTFFLLGGGVEVIYQLALQRGMVSPRLKLSRALMSSAVLSVTLIVGVYILLKFAL